MEYSPTYHFALLILLLAIVFGCKTTTPIETVSEKTTHDYGHHPSPISELYLEAELIVYMYMDSSEQANAPADGFEFYRITDSLTAPINFYQELNKQIQYPQMMLEANLQGRWYYELNFEHQLLTTWILKRGIEHGVAMEKEIDSVLRRYQNNLLYYSNVKSSCILVFRVVLRQR